MLQDIRHALRVFRRTPGVTAAALAALALGIGANTAIFSLMEAVLLRPLPYPQPDRLMSLAATDRRGAMNTSWPVFQDWQEQSRLFERMAAYAGGSANLTGAGEPERVGVVRVTPDMFAVIGASPWVGGLDGGVHTAVLSHGFWMRRFGGDRRSVGQALLLDGAPYTVSGVLPPGFRFPKWSMMDEPDVYVSLAPNPDRRFHFLRVIGRLKAGVAVAQAQTEMDQVSAAIGRAFPRANPGEGARVSPLQQDLTFGTGRTLGAFMAAVVLVLLIACANVSNLLLSQAVRRQREMAIRNALGAGRMRLIRQFLVESMALSLAGGALGVVLALWGIPLLEAAIPAHSAFSTKVAMGGAGIDLPVLGFAMAVSVASAVLFGVLPAWQASRSETSVRLRSRSTSGERARGVLIAVEVGLSLVLLAGAGLLLKSFVRLLSVDPGFRTRQLLTVDIELPEYRYGTAEKRAAFVRDVLARLGSVPGVASAAAVNAMPLSKVSARSSFRIAGSMQDLGPVDFRAVTPAYFAAMGIPVIRGATGECLVNQSMARVYWPNDDLVGKTIELQRGAVRLQFPITGIVGDVRHRGLDVEPRPELYVPFLAMPTDSFTLVLYSAGDRATLARAARQEIRAVDPDQPLAAVRTIEQLVGAEVAGWRFVLLLLAVFAAVAVTLASAGIFAVVAHSVAQRRREIGIRVALGAGSGEVVRTVVSSTLLWVAAGMAAGTAGALAAGRLLAGYLYDVQPRDPAALGIAALSLAAVAVVAAWIPARNAARVDPAITLRSE